MLDDEPCHPASANPLRRRYTLKDILLHVALVGLLLGGCVAWSRSSDYRARARLHALKEETAAEEALASRHLAAQASSEDEALKKKIEEVFARVEPHTAELRSKDSHSLSQAYQGLFKMDRELSLTMLDAPPGQDVADPGGPGRGDPLEGRLGAALGPSCRDEA
ncbi:hypothetical protein BSF38_03774 [Paludisphaera borealis]|uniref:Uncharacterized protein n=1 Tax=Paludisphaera borealis TaxID=1387353 RepID=A0A1U7CTK0_9BACT|nr:hypothetical protein BSF38_03774 [Paludisphaera borealis]